ncbi:MAG: class I SAM-dependent methyltransferase [Anaerolineaceae bacterium]
MSGNNQIYRWNEKYQQERYNTFFGPRQFLIDHQKLLPREGRALDVAMGLGGNAGYLIEHGLSVIGVDVSGVAVQKAKKRFPQIMAVQADLNHFYFPKSYYDVIINFFYLQRDIFPRFINSLRPGGLLIIETMTTDMLQIKPEIDPEYLLAPGELHGIFASSMEIITYQEGWTHSRTQHRRAVAGLVARLPG